jgi:hypothetical protein
MIYMYIYSAIMPAKVTGNSLPVPVLPVFSNKTKNLISTSTDTNRISKHAKKQGRYA